MRNSDIDELRDVNGYYAGPIEEDYFAGSFKEEEDV